MATSPLERLAQSANSEVYIVEVDWFTDLPLPLGWRRLSQHRAAESWCVAKHPTTEVGFATNSIVQVAGYTGATPSDVLQSIASDLSRLSADDIDISEPHPYFGGTTARCSGTYVVDSIQVRADDIYTLLPAECHSVGWLVQQTQTAPRQEYDSSAQDFAALAGAVERVLNARFALSRK